MDLSGGKYMVELICEFCSEHWVVLYGFLMFGIGEIYGYIKGRKTIAGA